MCFKASSHLLTKRSDVIKLVYIMTSSNKQLFYAAVHQATQTVLRVFRVLFLQYILGQRFALLPYRKKVLGSDPSLNQARMLSLCIPVFSLGALVSFHGPERHM